MVFLQFLGARISQNQKLEPLKDPKMTVFELLELPKLISRKIRVAVKLWNFHSVPEKVEEQATADYLGQNIHSS